MNLYETVTNSILDALNRGVVPWRKPWDSIASVPVNAESNRPYRGVNLFLLSMSPHEDHRWLTFNQVKNRGGSIRKGEKSTLVVFWKRWEPKADEEETEGSSPKRIPILRYFHVFNAEQCEGLDLTAIYRPQSAAEHERIAKADLLIQGMPNPPTIKENGRSAWYRPADDLITVPPLKRFTSADAFYGTLFHELGHATGHPNRLNRSGVTGNVRFGSGEYSKEELVAELTSAFCCATVSLDNSLLHDAASYIQGWLSILRDDPKAMVIAAAQAQKAADYIRGVTYV